MSAAACDCDVLIAGYGPVGAMLAALLAARGIRTIVVEQDRDVYPLPRAAHFDYEIMRLYQQLGVADAVMRHAQPAPGYEFRAADGQVLLSFDGFSRPSPSGWSTGYMFYQPGVERAVRAKIAALPAAAVRFEHRLQSLVQHADHVEATIIGPDGPGAVRARYLVGCDGAGSPVRAALGGGLEDYQFDEPWLVLDVLVRDPARMPKVNLQICDPARPTTCVLMGPGRHRWEFMLLPGETPEQVSAEGFIRALLAKWDCAGDVEIERKAVYRFHGLVARSWRSGRVLLAGDAAHQMPPFAGQGMCSGLRDAANLAWKLAAILQDGAAETLLDSYQREREPHVRAFIDLAIGMGRVVCTLDPAIAAARDAGMLAQRKAGAPALAPAAPPPFGAGSATIPSPAAGTLFPQPWGVVEGETVRLDDILGAGAWLISTEAAMPSMPALIARSVADPELAPFSAALGNWLSDRGIESVLVRPDRYVFGTGAAAALAAAFRECLHPPALAP
jgi:3-(3-hydroxy-phenyl)propionate hydroxylase